MIHRLILCIVLITVVGCNGQSKIDLQIPEIVTTGNTIERVRIPGTKILAHKPTGYEFIRDLLRFQKNTNTFIQFFEAPNTSFTNKVSEVKKGFEDNVKSGKMSALYYQKEFKLGAYNAILFYGPDNKPNLDQMVLAFGDNTFTVMAIGELPTNDKAARQEILTELLKITVDKSLDEDIETLKSFDISLANTSFKFNSKMSQIFCYTVNGEGNPAQNPFVDNIMVITYPPTSSSSYKDRVLDMIGRWKQTGVLIHKTTENNIHLNGNQALETVIEGEFQGRKNKIYFLTTSNKKSSVMFIGTTYDVDNKIFSQIETVAKTLTLK